MFEFQHIIQVNNPQDPQLLVLDRSQLWQGLILRARHPERFNDSLQCRCSDLLDHQFIRHVSAGGTHFKEQVTLTPESKIHTRTLPDVEQLFAESTALIEEPELNALFVRFSYRRELASDEQQLQITEYLKSAYVQLDRDAVAMIRMLAKSEL
ncbi:MAG: AtaL-like protein [Pseudohongiellaceae bacterium]